MIIRKPDGRPVVLYLAGPYSGDTIINIENARRIQVDLCEHGYFVVNPVQNTANFDLDCDCDYDSYLEGDIEIMLRCDILVLRPDWWNSSGARREAIRSTLARQPGIEYAPTAQFYADLHKIVTSL